MVDEREKLVTYTYMNDIARSSRQIEEFEAVRANFQQSLACHNLSRNMSFFFV